MGVHLHVDPDMLRKTAHVQLSLLTGVGVTLMAEDNIVALRVVLDGGGEGMPSEFRQTSALHWGPKAKMKACPHLVPALDGGGEGMPSSCSSA